MGEKYDCWYDDGPRLQYLRPDRIADLLGEGFPAGELGDMVAGGPAGEQRLSSCLGRPTDTMTQLGASVGEIVNGAGTDPAAVLAVGQRIEPMLTQGLTDIGTQITQSQVALGIVQNAGVHPAGELTRRNLEAARGLKHAVSQSLDPVSTAFGVLVGTVQDRAVSSVGNRVEALFDRITETAHAHAARVLRSATRHGADDAPEAGGSAAGGSAA